MSKSGGVSNGSNERKLIKSKHMKSGLADGEHNLWHALQLRIRVGKGSQSQEATLQGESTRSNLPLYKTPQLQPLSPAVQQLLQQAQDHLTETLPWYQSLAEDDKATLNLVIETAVANFVSWLSELEAHASADDTPRPSIDHIFFIAPLEFTQVVNLRQTLDVTRVIVNLLEGNVSTFSQPGHEHQTLEAILYFAREVAFSAAAIYADTAEMRENWNARTETFAMESLCKGVADSKVASQMSVLGWPNNYSCFALVGRLSRANNLTSPVLATRIRRKVQSLQARCLVSDHNDLTLVLIDPCKQGSPEEISSSLLHFFSHSAPLCLSPLRHNVEGAAEAICACLATYEVAPATNDLAISGGPVRPLHTDDVLPERALIGDRYAIDQLYREIYLGLRKGDPHHILLTTLHTFLACGRSLELAANKLSVHPNTVRYRLKQSVKITGWDPTHSREAFVLQVALKVGKICEARDQ